MSDKQLISIRMFGRLADLLGPEVELAVPPSCSVADLREELARNFPTAAHALRARRVRACVGDSIVPDDHRIRPGEHVEFLPPVSGG